MVFTCGLVSAHRSCAKTQEFTSVGLSDGDALGLVDGLTLGLVDGLTLGDTDGEVLGDVDGLALGLELGEGEGAKVFG